MTAVNPTKTLHVCLISATLLPLLGGTSQDINELIRQAEQRRDWKAVGELQLTIINRNGYHFGNATKPSGSQEAGVQRKTSRLVGPRSPMRTWPRASSLRLAPSFDD